MIGSLRSTSCTALLWRCLVAMALAALLSACAPIRVLNAVSAAGGSYDVRQAIAYGPDPRHKLDVYLPKSAAPASGWPLVVFFYGGSWNTGERADYAFVGASLASRGVVAVVADYRLYPQVRYPDFLEDSALALAWGFEHARALGADAKRVFVMGHSAGAYNAAMLALDRRWLAHTGHAPKALAGWIGLAGPYDFLPTDNPQVQPVFFHPNYPPRSQPVDHVTADAPPTFLGTPVEDHVVDPVRNTGQLQNELKAQGVAVQWQRYERATHVTLAAAFAPGLRWIAPVLDDVTRFIVGTTP